MTTNEILTLLAILFGPIIGVLLTRYLDNRREIQSRRFWVFSTLMRTRRQPISAEHVGALNLIEIEFAHDTKVMAAWRKLYEHFGTEHTRAKEEQITADMEASERQRRDERFGERLARDREKLRAVMLHEIAKALNFKIEQLEIFEGGYMPQGWGNDEADQRQIRNAMLAIMNGKRPLPTFNILPEDQYEWSKNFRFYIDDIIAGKRSLPITIKEYADPFNKEGPDG